MSSVHEQEMEGGGASVQTWGEACVQTWGYGGEIEQKWRVS